LLEVDRCQRMQREMDGFDLGLEQPYEAVVRLEF